MLIDIIKEESALSDRIVLFVEHFVNNFLFVIVLKVIEIKSGNGFHSVVKNRSEPAFVSLFSD